MTDNHSSGVRNLRAMFETPSAASSPEPRGRSPGRFNLDGAHPASKVRASFVSVEPSGHIARDLGTTKGTTDGVNSTQANRRESFSVSEDIGGETVADLKKAVSNEKEARKNSADVAETVPEQAVETRESSRAPPPIRETEDTMPNLGSIMKGSDFPELQQAGEAKSKADERVQAAAKPDTGAETIEDKSSALSPKDSPADKVVTEAQEEASLEPTDPKDEAAVSDSQALPPPTEVLPSTNAAEATASAPKAPESTPSKTKVNGASTPAKTNGASAAKRPPAISTTKASTAKTASSKSPLPRSPGVARLPKTPTTPKTASSASTLKSSVSGKEPAKAIAPKDAAKAPASKASKSSLKPSTASTTASAAAKAKAPVTENKRPAPRYSTAGAPAPKESTTTSTGGFKKPRPKSPTRAVRLPSHLTAPTASYAAKHGEDGAQKLARKPSAVSRPAPPKAAAPPPRKQPARASLAPSSASTKRPESRASTKGGADEGFLQRMMRPTTSSASKTHEKPVSPPRRGASTRAPIKPKAGHENVLAKSKKKVGDIAAKAKAVVTNSHGEEPTESDEASPSHEAAAEAAPGSSVTTNKEEAVTNGEGEAPARNAEPSASHEVAAKAAPDFFPPPEPEREATPMEQVESSAVELQTPSFEGQAIR